MLAYNANMKAKLVIERRFVYGDRDFVEAVVWEVPSPVHPSPHRFKYRLVYIVNGQRVVGFDNERGKGDHYHDGKTEVPYAFVSIDVLLDDFATLVETWRMRHGRP